MSHKKKIRMQLWVFVSQCQDLTEGGHWGLHKADAVNGLTPSMWRFRETALFRKGLSRVPDL